MCAVCGRDVCAGMRVVYRVCLWVVRAETSKETQPGKGRRSVCVVRAWCVGCVGVRGGRAETERHSQAKDNVRCVRAGCVCGMDIPHNLLVFSELIHHLRDQDHSHEM